MNIAQRVNYAETGATGQGVTETTDTGIQQRGAMLINANLKLVSKKREGQKRLTLALDGAPTVACGCMPPKPIKPTKTF